MSLRNVETVRAAHQAFNRRDFDAVVNSMTEDVSYRDQARDVTYNGRAGFREFMQGWVTTFSNASASGATYIDAGDTVVAEFTGTGVNDGPLGPMPATGRSVKFAICEVFRFNGEGKIVSGAIYYDQMSIMTQLGHVQAAPKTMSA
jgi:steroid delta-isomerase-like uncharacterized protein